MTNLKLLESPVVITFTNTETNTTKNVVVDNINKLNGGVEVLLENNVNIRYEIRSNGLVFDNYAGTFKLADATNSLTFNYYYINNFVLASVGLNPIGTIDMSKIDLSVNPVKIILKNDKHAYTFTFDDNSKFETKISQMVELGEYEYAILSNNLIFSSTSGKLTITTTDRNMLFNCAQSEEIISSFNLRGNPVNFSVNGKKRFLSFSIDKKLSALISEIYGSTGFNIDFNFYNANNKLQTLSIKGLDCSVLNYTKTYYETSYLGSNGVYKVQVRLYSTSSSSVYLSNFYEINVNLDWGHSSDDKTEGDYGLAFTLSL